jgi:predicted nucleotidyltransferase
MGVAIPIPHDRLAAVCRRHHIRRLSLFGSALREDFGPESDVDVLVEFESGHTPGREIVTIQDEISELLGRMAGLGTPNELSSHTRDRVLASAQVIYEHR